MLPIRLNNETSAWWSLTYFVHFFFIADESIIQEGSTVVA